jgi:hypothetical protein
MWRVELQIPTSRLNLKNIILGSRAGISGYMHSQITEKKLIGMYRGGFKFYFILRILTTACGDLVQALKECHESMFNKLTGRCNQAERELGLCLGREVHTIFFAETN